MEPTQNSKDLLTTPLSEFTFTLEEKLTFPERATDAINDFLASWSAFWWHVAIFGIWMTVNGINVWLYKWQIPHYDPFPYIFLNLFLSTEAAISTVFIMMSQKRAAERDRRLAEDLSRTALRAEANTEQIVLLLSVLTDQVMNNQETLVSNQTAFLNIRDKIINHLDNKHT